MDSASPPPPVALRPRDTTWPRMLSRHRMVPELTDRSESDAESLAGLRGRDSRSDDSLMCDFGKHPHLPALLQPYQHQ